MAPHHHGESRRNPFGRLGQFIVGRIRALDDAVEANRTYGVLSSLSDHQLHDLGFNRSDLRLRVYGRRAMR